MKGVLACGFVVGGRPEPPRDPSVEDVDVTGLHSPSVCRDVSFYVAFPSQELPPAGFEALRSTCVRSRRNFLQAAAGYRGAKRYHPALLDLFTSLADAQASSSSRL